MTEPSWADSASLILIALCESYVNDVHLGDAYDHWTATFQEDAGKIWSEEERGAFCAWLAANPKLEKSYLKEWSVQKYPDWTSGSVR
tara:strand:+ start:1898 stop:2158 length:261 start_codon:yes stop_codon:yes gene_type:complete